MRPAARGMASGSAEQRQARRVAFVVGGLDLPAPGPGTCQASAAKDMLRDMCGTASPQDRKDNQRGQEPRARRPGTYTHGSQLCPELSFARETRGGGEARPALSDEGAREGTRQEIFSCGGSRLNYGR